jgi:hypothetical protein
MVAWARRAYLILFLGLAAVQMSIGPGGAVGLEGGQTRVPGEILVGLTDGFPSPAHSRWLAARDLILVSSIPALGIELLQHGGSRDSADLVTLLESDAGVAWAEPNGLCRVALAEPDDPAYHEFLGTLAVQWPVHELDALTAWSCYPGCYFQASDRPQDVPLVALVDTGVDEAHPDFMNPGAPSADVSDGGQLVLSAAHTFLRGLSAPGARDEHGHGTHLAGIIAAATNNGATLGSGIAGLGYPVRLLPIRVTEADGVATHADIAQAVVYAADHGPSVILIGLAGPTWSHSLQEAVDYAWRRGCLLIAPSGDGGAEAPAFPAECNHVFGVASTTASESLAWYSGSGDEVAVSAPGGDESVGVYSTLPTYACTLRTDLSTPPYGWLFGTSQAAAHAAAAGALYAGSAGLWPPEAEEGVDIWQALQQSALRLGAGPLGTWDLAQGYGVVMLAPLLRDEGGPADVGSIVGRVLLSDEPAVGAVVSATTAGAGEAETVVTSWPAGGYRVANVTVGTYCVTATAEGMVGIWEGVEVRGGCDVPAIDFRLSDPRSDADLVSAQIPEAAVRGRSVNVSVTVVNTGDSLWTRDDGYCLRRAECDEPISLDPGQVGLAPGERVEPGGICTFSFALSVPDVCGFFGTSWQMCQQGGAGRFGDVAAGTISVTSFLDVPADYWALSGIEAAKEAGVVQGYGGDLYRPEWLVSRDQMAVYLSRVLAGGDDAVPPGPDDPTFPDVDRGHWAYPYVEYAHQRDIVRGYSDGTYRPERLLDRAQMGVFVARGIAGGESALDGYVPPAQASFPDVQPDHWAYKYVEYLKLQGIVAGYQDGCYHPEHSCSRAQMAVCVSRAWGLI